MDNLTSLLIWVFSLFGPICPPDMALAGLVCMDRYEAPNEEGARPLVMQSAVSAIAWCESRGKRLCTEREWEAACRTSSQECNNRKTWLPWEKETVATPREVLRLWQGSPSGSFPECRTASGIFDLTGNVEEWTVSSRGRKWPYTLRGGFWASKVSCGGSNDFHHPKFVFYETGARC